jgi:hypothetical protein
MKGWAMPWRLCLDFGNFKRVDGQVGGDTRVELP